MVQLRVLTRFGDSDLYTERHVLGKALSANRGTFVADGREAPTGGTSFDVPAGTVTFGQIVGHRGQYFRVDGVRPVDPFFTREILETTQVKGPFRLTNEFGWTIDGYRFAIDGDAVLVK